MVKNILSASHTLRALTLLLLSVCAFHGAWAEDQQAHDHVGNVVFHIPEGMVNGASDDTNGSYSVTPSKQSGVRSFVIPTNYTFFRNKDKDGYASTLQYWVAENGDTTVHYVPGYSYTFASEGQTLTLVPVFKDNPASAVNRTNVTVMRFDLRVNCTTMTFLTPISAVRYVPRQLTLVAERSLSGPRRCT